MRATLYAAVVATAGVIAMPAGASAQTPATQGSSEGASTSNQRTVASGPSAQGRAVAHYERGWAHYAAGRYRAAAAELETAVRLDPTGYNLYFDLGLVYERLGDIDRAIGAYRRYFALASDPAERERADRIVRRLQGARAELADVAPRRGHADALFWAVTGSSLASLTIGGVLLFSAVRTDDHAARLRMSGSQIEARAAEASAGSQHIAADVLLIGGGALAITAALLYFLREAPPRNIPVCVSAGPRGGSLVLRF